MLSQDTFQAKKKYMVMLAYICGFYWPGVDLALSSRRRKLFFGYCCIITYISGIMNLVNVIALILYPSTMATLLFVARKNLGISRSTFKLLTHMVPSRRRQLQQLYYTWNYDINTGNDKRRMQKLLKGKLEGVKRMFLFASICGVFMLQITTFMLFFSRNMGGAEGAYVPHNPQAWYHYYLVALQLITYTLPNMSFQIFNYFHLVLLAMAEAQLQLLRGNLKRILKSNESNGHVRKNIQHDINAWIKNHQKTIRWINDLISYSNFLSTLNFSFFGAYTCLSVFTVPGYIRAGNVVDVMLISMYGITSFSQVLYQSRMCEKICIESSSLFDDAYDSYWFMYPKSVTRCLSIIQIHSKNRPHQIKTFSIMPDNSETFLWVMQTAYTALSFLLQLDIL